MNKAAWIGLVAGTILAGGSAGAVEPSVVVLEPQHNLQGDVDQVLSDVRARVGSALDEGGWAVVPDDVSAGCAGTVPGGATDASRLSGTAEACLTQAAVGVRIDASAMGYALRLVLVAADGTVVADQEASCDFCTEGEMVDKWSELTGGVGAPSPELVAAANAAVEPVEPVEPVGPVEPVEPVEPEEPASTFSAGDIPWWVWVGGAASLGAIGAGIPLIVMDGDITCDGGPVEACPDIYDTDAIGYSLLAVGVAGLGAVGVGLYFALSDDEAPPSADGSGEGAGGVEEPAIAILPGLGGFVVRGVFDL